MTLVTCGVRNTSLSMLSRLAWLALDLPEGLDCSSSLTFLFMLIDLTCDAAISDLQFHSCTVMPLSSLLEVRCLLYGTCLSKSSVLAICCLYLCIVVRCTGTGTLVRVLAPALLRWWTGGRTGANGHLGMCASTGLKHSQLPFLDALYALMSLWWMWTPLVVPLAVYLPARPSGSARSQENQVLGPV